MKAIFNRLRRLENAAAPAERERAAVESILAAMRRRLGASYEPPSFPPESFAGCRTVADRIRRANQLLREREARQADERESQNRCR
jgi:hypothetical protein